MSYNAHTYRMFRRNPSSVKMALPISTFHWRITRTTFGFRTAADRQAAHTELRRRFGKDVSVTYYMDTNAHIAAQVIFPAEWGI